MCVAHHAMYNTLSNGRRRRHKVEGVDNHYFFFADTNTDTARWSRRREIRR